MNGRRQQAKRPRTLEIFKKIVAYWVLFGVFSASVAAYAVWRRAWRSAAFDLAEQALVLTEEKSLVLADGRVVRYVVGGKGDHTVVINSTTCESKHIKKPIDILLTQLLVTLAHSALHVNMWLHRLS